MAATAAKTAATVELSTGWTNCTAVRLATNDASRTTTTSTSYTTGFQISDFNFGLLSTYAIDGIAIAVDLSNSAAGQTSTVKCSLSWNDGTNWTADSSEQAVTGTTDAVKTYGGATDVWGRAWGYAELADGTFRVRVQGKSSSASYQCRIDQVTVTIYYHVVTRPKVIFYRSYP